MREFNTVYDIIDGLRQKPGLFVGALTDRPFEILSAFLAGLSWSKIDPGTPDVWGFWRWITARIDGISKNLPDQWLLEKHGSAAAYEAFFDYLDEYRACKEIEISVLNSASMAPGTHLRDYMGSIHSPPKPDKIYVGQYSPSNVFFLGEVYGDNIECWFPYHQTANDAMEDARRMWGVPLSAWTTG